MNIAEKIRYFHSVVPADVQIVAVSKFHPASLILEAYDAGQRVFGESRVQEFLEKQKTLPKDIHWHFIGHLQTNKVKQIIGKTTLIESVDSLKLLNLINEESEKANVETNVLLQAHIAEEETKFGFYPEEFLQLCNPDVLNNLKNVKICGLMGMATNTDDKEKIKGDFISLHNLFSEIKNNKKFNLPYFSHLSMGMSGDWPLAIKEGANIIRIGSAIFGEREF